MPFTVFRHLFCIFFLKLTFFGVPSLKKRCMDMLEESFDELFKGRGGLFPYEGMNNPMYVIALAYSRSLVRNLGQQTKSNLAVYVGLIDNNEFGTFSTKKDRQYFIGINKGTIDVLLNIFTRMLANSRLVTFIGNWEEEPNAHELYDPTLLQAEQLEWPEIVKLLPRNFTRKEMACQFVMTAIEFLVSHEYAHILYGHIDYHYSPFGRTELRSPEGEPSSESEVSILQALELIADDFAVGTGLLVLQGKHEDRESVPPAISHLYDSWSSMLRLWYFPVYTCFRIFGQTNKAYLLEGDAYMPPAVRANMVMETTAFVMEEVFRSGIGTAVLSDLLVGTCIAVEEALADLGGGFDL
jgi:hypothetical protein